MTIERHEDWLKNHEKRINALEVNQAVITTKVTQIAKWAGWGVALLGGSLIVQFANLLMKGIAE